MSECAFIVYECYVNDGLQSYVPVDDSDALEEYALMQCEDAAHIVWWDDGV